VDIINGDADNDNLSGPQSDGAIDTLNGGAGTDVCERPGLLQLFNRDVLIACNP
jgi:hypothetical protein